MRLSSAIISAGPLLAEPICSRARQRVPVMQSREYRVGLNQTKIIEPHTQAEIEFLRTTARSFQDINSGDHRFAVGSITSSLALRPPATK